MVGELVAASEFIYHVTDCIYHNNDYAHNSLILRQLNNRIEIMINRILLIILMLFAHSPKYYKNARKQVLIFGQINIYLYLCGQITTHYDRT